MTLINVLNAIKCVAVLIPFALIARERRKIAELRLKEEQYMWQELEKQCKERMKNK